MALIVPTESENTNLGFMLGFATPGNQILKLFTNDIIPADTDVAATYTEMATLGYEAKSLVKGSWTIAQNGGVAEASQAAQTWTFSAGTAVTVFGYFVVDTTTGVLLWAERFVAGKVVQYAGDQIIITPKITLSKV